MAARVSLSKLRRPNGAFHKHSRYDDRQDLSRRAAVNSFVLIVEADHQLQDISWPVVGTDQQHHVKIAPAHEVRDVATGHRHRADVIEDSRLGELIQESGRLRMQRRLPSRKLFVGVWFLHDG
ncbi:MAG TPA: hypothetical protein VI094_14750 [Propionibacteriaceae bacterium]